MHIEIVRRLKNEKYDYTYENSTCKCCISDLQTLFILVSIPNLNLLFKISYILLSLYLHCLLSYYICNYFKDTEKTI